MTFSRPLPRASPSRIKTSKVAALEPSQIPLPPSPPASDGHIVSDPISHRCSSSPQRLRRNCSRSKTSPALNSGARVNCRATELVHASQLPSLNSTSSRTREKRHRATADQSDSSSPPTSPSNRQSARSAKRYKLMSPSPSRRLLRPSTNHRDSPSNPFLTKPGEKPRRADSRRDGGRRQLVYVFRGKRIPYDSAEDLDQDGGSPFSLSGPKLLFPSPPSPAPVPKLQFQLEEETVAGSSSLTSPQRSTLHPNHFAFQTPKRDKSKSNLAASAMLPTPQSRPRRTQRAHPDLSNQALNGVVKSGRTMAKAMR